MQPRELAQMMMGGSIATKASVAARACGLEIEAGHDENCLLLGERVLRLVSLRTKRDLAIALHEIAHAGLGHTENTVQNECEADLFSDAVMLELYGDTWLFGRVTKATAHYSGDLDVEALEAFARVQGISINIREELKDVAGEMDSLSATIQYYQETEEARTREEFDARVGPPLCLEYRSPWRPGEVGCGACPVAALLDEGEQCRVVQAEFGIWMACELGTVRPGVRLEYPLDIFADLDIVEWLVGIDAITRSELVRLIEDEDERSILADERSERLTA